MKNKPGISVKDLNVWYQDTRVLKDISVDIPSNKITTIIGPSGCGKTTLLKSLNQLIYLQDEMKVEGQVLMNGENVLDRNIEVTHLRKQMGLLLQKPQVLPMSIFDNVAYGARIHGTRDKKTLQHIVEKYLKLVGLWDEVEHRLYTSPSKLSIGQQQRLCLARGLAVEPEVILGDEPTTALDPVSSQHIEQKFTELKHKYTIVIVTHILRQARRLADYVVFLYLGELIEHGPAEELFDHPKQALTREYIKGIIS